jgi:hypothetical protein
MAGRRRPANLESGLIHLEPVKGSLVSASDRAGHRYRDCATCDAHCCRVGFNSMLVSRIEAVAIARRLLEPDLSGRIDEIRERARREVEVRGLLEDPDANYDCPLLGEDGRCLVHGTAQPAGCLTFVPVADGGCDHDLGKFAKALPRIEEAERRAYGDVSEPRPIPVAILEALAGRIGGMERYRKYIGRELAAERLADGDAIERLGFRGRWVPEELMPFDEVELARSLDGENDLLLTLAVEEGKIARLMFGRAPAGDDDADAVGLSPEELGAALEAHGGATERLLDTLTTTRA